MTHQEKPLPIVLILDRFLDPNGILAERNNEIIFKDRGLAVHNDTSLIVDLWFRFVDASGSRCVWSWGPTDDYDDAEDLPLEVFDIVEQWVNRMKQRGELLGICMRREDPGLGIYIPEVDNAVIAAGELPDGVIQVIPKSPD